MTDDISNDESTLEVEVPEEADGLRLDVFLADAIEDASRSFVQRVIKDEHVRINGHPAARPSRTVRTDDLIEIDLPPPPPTDLQPEDIPLEVLFEDKHILVINKPSGLVVHPAPGHSSGTLVNAVLHHCRDFERPVGGLSGYGVDAARPGIVHRLDRFTSGVMVVGKTHAAFGHLAQQAREHTFDRRYLAIVRGEFKEEHGVINASIGRSLSARGRMAVTSVNSREAVTHFHVQERFGIASLVALELETGRTHQIRVHLRFAGKPVLGDPVYGVTDYSHWDIEPDLLLALNELEGQALHAELLGLEHPATHERMQFTAPPPADFQRVLTALRAHAAR